MSQKLRFTVGIVLFTLSISASALTSTDRHRENVRSHTDSVRIIVPVSPFGQYIPGAEQTDAHNSSDLSWLDEVSDCASMETRIVVFSSSIGDRLLHKDVENIKSVLKVACGPRFNSCNFDVCKEEPWILSDDADSSTNNPNSDTAENPPTYPTHAFSASSASSANTSQDYTVDERPGMAWINRELTCDQVFTNIKTRYSKSGQDKRIALQMQTRSDRDTIEEELQNEKVSVKFIACGPRFKTCKFSFCSKNGSKSKDPIKKENEARGRLSEQEIDDVAKQLLQ